MVYVWMIARIRVLCEAWGCGMGLCPHYQTSCTYVSSNQLIEREKDITTQASSGVEPIVTDKSLGSQFLVSSRLYVAYPSLIHYRVPTPQLKSRFLFSAGSPHNFSYQELSVSVTAFSFF